MLLEQIVIHGEKERLFKILSVKGLLGDLRKSISAFILVQKQT